MFGTEDSIGLLRQSGQYILNSASQSKILASAYEIIDKQCFDLTKKRTQLNGTMASIITVSSEEELKTFVEHIFLTRAMKATNQNEKSSRSHLFVILSIEGSDSKMAFIDLAGFESMQGKEGGETIFINTSLFEFNNYLVSLKQKTICRTKMNTMMKHVEPFLKSESRATIMFHVNDEALKKGLEYIKDIATSSIELKRFGTPLGDVTNKMKK